MEQGCQLPAGTPGMFAEEDSRVRSVAAVAEHRGRHVQAQHISYSPLQRRERLREGEHTSKGREQVGAETPGPDSEAAPQALPSLCLAGGELRITQPQTKGPKTTQGGQRPWVDFLDSSGALACKPR